MDNHLKLIRKYSKFRISFKDIVDHVRKEGMRTLEDARNAEVWNEKHKLKSIGKKEILKISHIKQI